MPNCKTVQFSGHAFTRMFSRRIRIEEVKYLIEFGETIAEYPDDKPFPSVLLLGFTEGNPIHVVVAMDQQTGLCRIVTVYRPDPIRWSEDFKTKKPTER